MWCDITNDWPNLHLSPNSWFQNILIKIVDFINLPQISVTFTPTFNFSFPSQPFNSRISVNLLSWTTFLISATSLSFKFHTQLIEIDCRSPKIWIQNSLKRRRKCRQSNHFSLTFQWLVLILFLFLIKSMNFFIKNFLMDFHTTVT
jgi:hypothetical protein